MHYSLSDVVLYIRLEYSVVHNAHPKEMQKLFKNKLFIH